MRRSAPEAPIARQTPTIRLIAGPTASGKSALALELARSTGAVILNADSQQLYADLRVLTARPGPEEEALAEHRLYGIADAAESWSVGRWLRAVTAELQALAAEGRPALVVGGTGLYFHALTRGLAETPPVPEAVRAAAARRYDDQGEAAFRDALSRLDPAAEARIAPRDRQRLVRAAAVAEATGRPLSAWQADTRPALAPGIWEGVVVEPPRERLYARCDARLERMVAEGALEEVERLLARRLDPATPCMKAVGVRELAAHVQGRAPLETALEDARRATRQYAKRQLTWFRNQTPDWPRRSGLEA